MNRHENIWTTHHELSIRHRILGNELEGVSQTIFLDKHAGCSFSSPSPGQECGMKINKTLRISRDILLRNTEEIAVEAMPRRRPLGLCLRFLSYHRIHSSSG